MTTAVALALVAGVGGKSCPPVTNRDVERHLLENVPTLTRAAACRIAKRVARTTDALETGTRLAREHVALLDHRTIYRDPTGDEAVRNVMRRPA